MVRKLDQVLPSKLCLANKKALVNKKHSFKVLYGRFRYVLHKDWKSSFLVRMAAWVTLCLWAVVLAKMVKGF